MSENTTTTTTTSERLTYEDLQTAVQSAMDAGRMMSALELMEIKDTVKRLGGRSAAYLDEVLSPAQVSAVARYIAAAGREAGQE